MEFPWCQPAKRGLLQGGRGCAWDHARVLRSHHRDALTGFGREEVVSVLVASGKAERGPAMLGFQDALWLALALL